MQQQPSSHSEKNCDQSWVQKHRYRHCETDSSSFESLASPMRQYTVQKLNYMLDFYDVNIY